MKIIKKAGIEDNYLATIAIGESYLSTWEKFARPHWENYCEKYDLGLVVFNQHLIHNNHPKWKKPNWQKLLIGDRMKKSGFEEANVCYLDTDIIISPIAQNIFKEYDPSRFGLTSLRNRLPFPYLSVLRRLAFLRHKHYGKTYPLDSALFMSLEQLYSYHNLPTQSDEACTALILFNVAKHY